MPAQPTGRLFLIAALLVAAGFVAIGCLWLDRPGLQYDESLFVAATYPNPQRGGTGFVELLGEPVCVLVLPYLGGLKGWLYRPILELVPPSAAAVRAPVMVLGGLTLLLFFFLARRMFGPASALLAIALAATDPIFLFTTRLDWGPVVIQRFCLVAGCLLLLRWKERPAPRRLFLGTLLFGLGLFDKLSFAWLLIALLAAALVVYRRQFLERLNRKTILAAALGLLIGYSPALVCRLTSTLPATGIALETDLSQYHAKLSMLHHALDGRVFQGGLSYVTAPDPAPSAGWLSDQVSAFAGDRLMDATWFGWALLACCVALPWTLRTQHRRALLFVLLFSVGALVQMMATATAGSVHHQVLIYPFPHLFVAASLAAATSRWKQSTHRTNAAYAAVLIGILLVAANLRTTVQQYGQILQFGGTTAWSEAIFSLNDRLQAAAASQIVILDWGIGQQLRLLSRDTLPVREAPQPVGGDPYFQRTIEEALGNPDALFVGYVSPLIHPQTSDLFRETARQNGKDASLVKTVNDRQGRPVYQIWAARESEPRP